MNIEFSAEEGKIIKHALEDYLSNLREEIVKAEKHDWKVKMKQEEEVLKKIIGILA